MPARPLVEPTRSAADAPPTDAAIAPALPSADVPVQRTAFGMKLLAAAAAADAATTAIVAHAHANANAKEGEVARAARNDAATASARVQHLAEFMETFGNEHRFDSEPAIFMRDRIAQEINAAMERDECRRIAASLRGNVTVPHMRGYERLGHEPMHVIDSLVRGRSIEVAPPAVI